MKPPAEFKVMPVRECVATSNVTDTPQEVFNYWQANIPQSVWFDPCKEALVVFMLNTRRRILGHNLVALGGLDTIYVHPREVYRPAVIMAASAIILAHNHPSGDPSPSDADIRTNRDMIRAGQILKIDLLDHIIIGTQFRSLRELGCFHV